MRWRRSWTSRWPGATSLRRPDIELNAEGEQKPVIEAIYPKYYKQHATLEPIREANLIPKLRALCQALDVQVLD